MIATFWGGGVGSLMGCRRAPYLRWTHLFWGVWERAKPSPAPHVGDMTLEWSAWHFWAVPSLACHLASDIDALVIAVALILG